MDCIVGLPCQQLRPRFSKQRETFGQTGDRDVPGKSRDVDGGLAEMLALGMLRMKSGGQVRVHGHTPQPGSNRSRE